MILRDFLKANNAKPGFKFTSSRVYHHTVQVLAIGHKYCFVRYEDEDCSELLLQLNLSGDWDTDCELNHCKFSKFVKDFKIKVGSKFRNKYWESSEIAEVVLFTKDFCIFKDENGYENVIRLDHEGLWSVVLNKKE